MKRMMNWICSVLIAFILGFMSGSLYMGMKTSTLVIKANDLNQKSQILLDKARSACQYSA